MTRQVNLLYDRYCPRAADTALAPLSEITRSATVSEPRDRAGSACRGRAKLVASLRVSSMSLKLNTALARGAPPSIIRVKEMSASSGLAPWDKALAK